jgi:hypothetical protein
MELYLCFALAYMLWENWSLTQVILQLRHNQKNYISMLTDKDTDEEFKDTSLSDTPDRKGH